MIKKSIIILYRVVGSKTSFTGFIISARLMTFPFTRYRPYLFQLAGYGGGTDRRILGLSFGSWDYPADPGIILTARIIDPAPLWGRPGKNALSVRACVRACVRVSVRPVKKVLHDREVGSKSLENEKCLSGYPDPAKSTKKRPKRPATSLSSTF